MKLALAVARKAHTLGEVPVGAVVVDPAGRVLAMDHNRPISLHDPSAHAEILVLRKAAHRLGNYRLVSCSIYVTLEPCIMCYGAIIQARIRRLIYGTDDPKGGAFHSCLDLTTPRLFNHYIEVKGGVCGGEAAKLLWSFFATRRK